MDELAEAIARERAMAEAERQRTEHVRLVSEIVDRVNELPETLALVALRALAFAAGSQGAGPGAAILEDAARAALEKRS